MAGTITRTACPKCKEVGYLHIITRFVAKPLGTWSLAGAQVKTTGSMKPILKCHNCDFDLVGEFDGDFHATFQPPTGDPPA
jgi:hypothetical protein